MREREEKTNMVYKEVCACSCVINGEGKSKTMTIIGVGGELSVAPAADRV